MPERVNTQPFPLLLVVDDERAIRSTIKRAFKDRFDVQEAASGEEALSLIRHGLKPRILLADMYMDQGMSGIDLFSHTIGIAPTTKRVLMTGRADLETALAAVNKGHIHYFIRKPYDISELTAVFDQMNRLDALERQNELLVLELKFSNSSLMRANRELKQHKELLLQSLDERSAELLTLVRQLEEANRELKRKAVRDGLTGLYNHVTVKHRLEEEIARARRYKAVLSLIFIDIDHFKLYNDRLGHDVGDTVLTAVAGFLMNGSDEVSPSRKSDVIGRYGGEEFVIILPETNHEGAVIRAERLRRGIMRLRVPGAQEQPLGSLSVSMGVASYPDHAQSATDLLKRADEALYLSKESGRNRVSTPESPL